MTRRPIMPALLECWRSVRFAGRAPRSARGLRSPGTAHDRPPATHVWDCAAAMPEPSSLLCFLHGPQLYCKATAPLVGIVSQTAAVRAKDGSRDVQPQTEGVGTRLEGPEQFFRLRHPGTGIAETHEHDIVLHCGRYGHLTDRHTLQRLLAVARQVD